MNSDVPPLKCFQHCSKDVDLVCLYVPNTCPICKKDTATTESGILPYILPSPFSSSEKHIRSVVLKPTGGDFIQNYVQTCNLHIGISDENGFVYDFDENGLKYGPPWPECLAVSLNVASHNLMWDSSLLDTVSDTELWRKDRYHEERWNCFDFVLCFTKCLDTFVGCSLGFAKMSKEEFTNLFLTRKTKRAEQYIHLYRQAMATGCVTVVKEDSSGHL